MQKEYKSTEQRIWEIFKPKVEKAGDFLNYSIRSFYGALVTPLRISTFSRKNFEKQTLADEVDSLPKKEQGFTGSGMITGVGLGVVTYLLGFCTLSTYTMKTDDYIPLVATATILGITNAASGIYETIRSSKKIKNLEQHTNSPQ